MTTENMLDQIENAKVAILAKYSLPRSAGERAALQSAECRSRGIAANGPDTATYDRLDGAAKTVRLIDAHEKGSRPVIRGASRESVLAANARQAGLSIDDYIRTELASAGLQD